MSIREDIERMECETLSPYATLSIHSRGRDAVSYTHLTLPTIA